MRLLLMILLTWAIASPAGAQNNNGKIRLVVGKTATGFHIPQQWQGRTIYAGWPTNEHTIFAIEDLMKAIGADVDVLILETDARIRNAYAVVDTSQPTARRMVVFDGNWFSHMDGATYRMILAHEIGHQVCKHTLGEFSGAPWDKELEADRTAGAILRKAFDADIAIGGATVDYASLVQSAAQMFSADAGSATHPPGQKRIEAYIKGWNGGSTCLQKAYVPINPVPTRDPSAAERIVLRYGSDQTWSFNSPFLGHSYLKSEITGDRIRLVYSRPSNAAVAAGARVGSVAFEGTAEGREIEGTFTLYVAGCRPIPYPLKGTFTENNGIFLVGDPPRMEGCFVGSHYAPTLHLFKNTSDWGFEPPRR